jgi:hypothetical protein
MGNELIRSRTPLAGKQTLENSEKKAQIFRAGTLFGAARNRRQIVPEKFSGAGTSEKKTVGSDTTPLPL